MATVSGGEDVPLAWKRAGREELRLRAWRAWRSELAGLVQTDAPLEDLSREQLEMFGRVARARARHARGRGQTVDGDRYETFGSLLAAELVRREAAAEMPVPIHAP